MKSARYFRTRRAADLILLFLKEFPFQVVLLAWNGRTKSSPKRDRAAPDPAGGAASKLTPDRHRLYNGERMIPPKTEGSKWAVAMPRRGTGKAGPSHLARWAS